MPTEKAHLIELKEYKDKERKNDIVEWNESINEKIFSKLVEAWFGECYLCDTLHLYLS